MSASRVLVMVSFVIRVFRIERFCVSGKLSFAAANAVEANGNQTVLMGVLVTTVSHVLGVRGHRRGRRFGSGRLALVTGATGKRGKREGGKAGEDQGRGA